MAPHAFHYTYDSDLNSKLLTQGTNNVAMFLEFTLKRKWNSWKNKQKQFELKWKLTISKSLNWWACSNQEKKHE